MTDHHTRPLRIAVLVKQVPPYDSGPGLAPDGRLRRQDADAELNAWCRRAVTRAVELARATGGHVTAVTMGPPRAADVLREAVACGVDEGLHLTDPVWAGADCLVTAHALAAALRHRGPFDVVLTGRSSTDGATSAVGPMVAELLGMPFAGPVLGLTPIDGGRLAAALQRDGAPERAEVTLPAVLSVAERSCRAAKAPRDAWPRSARIATYGSADLPGTRTAAAGPTAVLGLHPAPADRRPVLLTDDLDRAGDVLDLIRERLARYRPALPEPLPGQPSAVAGPAVLAVTEDPASRATRALLGAAARLAEGIRGHVVVAAPPGPATRLGTWGADMVLELTGTGPRPVARALTGWVAEHGLPWAVVGGTTAWDREVLARLGVTLDGGLMSDLTALTTRPGDPGLRCVGTKPVGGALADITAHGPTRIATLHTGCLALPEPRPVTGLRRETLPVAGEPALRTTRRAAPGDHDALDRAAAVIGIGAGVRSGEHPELLALRKLFDAEFAATRKVTDAGTLPHDRQLGITGRSLAPRLYLAVGISGSRDHMVGVTRADTVVAINHDPDAAILRHCDIGLVADWRSAARALVRAAATRNRRCC